jgi:CMP-N,N'-diacetyllegionaminic acid synthase
MKVLGIIPARGGSKGILRKNLKILGDKPLIAYSIDQALTSKLLSKVIVSTEDAEIASVAKAFGADVPFLRPSILATDEASSIEVVQHAIAFFESKGEFYDAICLLQPTSPFREKGFVDQSIRVFIDENSSALVSVLEVPHEFNPHWTFESDNNGLLKIATGEREIIKRRQDLPKAYFRDGSIYLTKTELIKSGTFYGNQLSYIVNNPDLYVNIDNPKDWDIAQEKLPTILSLL